MIMGPFERGLYAPDIAPSTSGSPVPVPPSMSAIFLPADQYLHRGAPTEWWWHVGTLKSGDRIFGFEINAAAFSDRGYAISQIMLTDVANAKHYQRTTLYTPPVGVDFDNWAQHDVTKDWHVGLGSAANCLSAIEVTNPGTGYSSDPTIEITGGGGSQAIACAVPVSGQISTVQLTNPGRGYTSAPSVSISGGGGTGATAKAVHSYVTMDAAWGDPTKGMAVVALLSDEASDTEIYFDLMLSQQGPPFIVWGIGVLPGPSPASGTHLQTNNYYYSLPRLAASGSITIGGEKFAVTGLTWMDHQYGHFGSAAKPVKWILQDAQLDNGWTLSNFAVIVDSLPKLGQETASLVTLQDPTGAMYLQPSCLTPVGRTWTSPASGITYFMQFEIKIPAFAATLNISTLVDPQEFPPAGPVGAVYEGVAAATGTFAGKPVSGTAWNEQAFASAEAE
jgi:predicted secreted hydrolase